MEREENIQKRASAYKLTNRIIFHSNSKTHKDLWIASEPYITLPIKSPLPEIGKAIDYSLIESKTDVDFPIDHEAIIDKLLLVSNKKTYRKIQQNSSCCYISKSSSRIEITPTHNGDTSGNEKGYYFIPSQKNIIGWDSSLIIKSNHDVFFNRTGKNIVPVVPDSSHHSARSRET